MAIVIKYKASVTSLEPWRGVAIPPGRGEVDLLPLISNDDAFSPIFPITRVFTQDQRLFPKGSIVRDNAAEVNRVRVEDLTSSSEFFVERIGGSTLDYTTVLPGPMGSGELQLGRSHRLRIWDECAGAFIRPPAGGASRLPSAKAIMLESVPGGALSPEVAKMFRYSDHVDHQLAIDTHHTADGHNTEAQLQGEWSQAAIPTSRAKFEAPKWKARIRRGVPSIHRYFVLPTLLEQCLVTGHQSLDEAMKWTYSWAPSSEFDPKYSPSFGAQYLSGLHETMPLTRSGWMYHKHILTCLSQQQPDITSCALLPSVLAHLLTVLSPNEAFITASKLMHLSRRETVSTIRYLPMSDVATSSIVSSAVDIVVASGLNLAKRNLSQELLGVLFEDICLGFFCQTFPLVYSLRILDMYIAEGIKILIRVFVGILKVHLAKIGERDSTQFLLGGPSVPNSLFNTCTSASFESVLEEGFKLSLSKADIKWTGTTPQTTLVTRKELIHWPSMTEGAAGSKILGNTLTWFEEIYANIPMRCTNVRRVYRASDDGWNLQGFYNSMAKQTISSAIILLQTVDGVRAGVYTSEMEWRTSKAFVGCHTDFLFAVGQSAGGLVCYPCPGTHRQNVLLCERGYLTAGEGPAFRIDLDIQSATSAMSPTFSSPRLWDDVARLVDIEIFLLM